MKPGDLIRDKTDGEIGLVVSNGKGYNPVTLHDQEYMPSYLIKWPSLSGLCELGADALDAGLVELVSKA